MAEQTAGTAKPRQITPEAMLSYPYLFKPRADDKGVEKYSCALVFAPGTNIDSLKLAVLGVLTDRFGEAKGKEMFKKKTVTLPFRDDAEAKGYAPGSVFFNARTTTQPGIVSIFPDTSKPKNAAGKHPPKPITDPNEIYAGCIVRASVTAFWYDNSGKKGVSFALNNIQKIADGERLDGRQKAEDEFDADDTATADLSDLTGGGEVAQGEDDIADLLK